MPTLRQIRSAVCAEFKVSATELTGSSRTSRIAHARAIFCALARGITQASYAQIGNEIGGREHATAMHLKKRGIQLIRQHPEYLHKVQRIREALRAML